MAIYSGIDLGEWFRANISKRLGFSIATVNAEPVHILNGLLVRSIEGPRAPDLAAKLIVTNGPSWQYDDNQIAELTASSDSAVSFGESHKGLDSTRWLLRKMLDSDNAVYASYQSYQVAYSKFISVDATGYSIGLTCAQLLLAHGGGRQEIRQLIDRLTRPQPDPWWAIQRALAGPAEPHEFSVADVGRISWASNPGAEKVADDLGALLRRTVKLAAHDNDSLEGLRVLANAAELSCMLIYALVPSLLSGNPVPLMLAAVGEHVPSIKESSSRGSLAQMNAAMHEWIVSELEHAVRDQLESKWDNAREAKALLRASSAALAPSAQVRRREKARELMESAPGRIDELLDPGRDDSSGSASRAAALVLADLLRATLSQDYTRWFDHHGRRCGFVAPRRGPGQKYFCVEAPLATTLVLAGLEDDEADVAFDTWLSRLKDRFGIIVGPCEEARLMTPHPDEQDLETNRDNLAELLRRVGLARAFNDNTVEIVSPLSQMGSASARRG